MKMFLIYLAAAVVTGAALFVVLVGVITLVFGGSQP
jgi:hypothetical protein